MVETALRFENALTARALNRAPVCSRFSLLLLLLLKSSLLSQLNSFGFAITSCAFGDGTGRTAELAQTFDKTYRKTPPFALITNVLKLTVGGGG